MSAVSKPSSPKSGGSSSLSNRGGQPAAGKKTTSRGVPKAPQEQEESLFALSGDEANGSEQEVEEDNSPQQSSAVSNNAGFNSQQVEQISAIVAAVLGQMLPSMLHQRPRSISPAARSAAVNPLGSPPASAGTSPPNNAPAGSAGLGSIPTAPTLSGHSAATAAPSYSSASAGSAPANGITASFAVSTAGLYGNPDKLPASLPALKPLPKNADYDAFEEWKRNAINDMINTGGMKEVVTLPPDQSLQLAVDTDTARRTKEEIKQLWLKLHAKACAVLKTAFTGALKTTPEIEAEQEQARRPGEFIQDNAHWLWEFASKQFVPDHIGRIAKALDALQRLSFVPNKTTPTDYYTAFRSAINDIRSADARQDFTEKVRVAFFLKGWPAQLHQQLNMVKAMPNPTVDDAQRLLQQWYNDHGKKKTSPSDPTPASSDTKLAALTEQEHRKKKELKKIEQRKKQMEKRLQRSESSTDDKSAGHTLGAMVVEPRRLHTNNPFAALADTDASASTETDSRPLAAVSADGLEYLNARNEFLLDSGAARNVVHDHSLLRDPQPLDNPVYLRCAMGRGTLLQEQGSVKLSKRLTLANVAHAKGARLNAISVSRAADSGYYSVFGGTKAIVVKKTALDAALRKLKPADIAMTVPRVGDLYIYSRPGTDQQERGKEKPSLQVSSSPNSIPLKGQQKQSKTATAIAGASSRASTNAQGPPSSSNTSFSPAPAAQPAPPRQTRSTATAALSAATAVAASSSQPPPQATLAALSHATVLETLGLPPDTQIEVAEWYALGDSQHQS